VNVLERFSRMGTRRPEIAPVARMLVEGMYLVLYKTHPDTDDGPVETVEIVRIIHGHRNLEHIF
jgi:toxin ParE1/3/4